MFPIIRRDPFQDFFSMRSLVDRLFENALGERTWGWSQPWVDELAMDVVENEDEFIVKASLPGINPDDLDIIYSGNTLTIKGEVKSEEEKDSVRYHLRERRYGNFSRSITLPAAVDSEGIAAKYEAGVLELRLPKVEEAKPKRIAVKTSAPQMIEGRASDITGKN